MEPRTESSSASHTGNGWFETTHWSVVLGATDESANGDAALARLCTAYWRPLYGFVRRSGHSPEDAQDLTQEFFARLLAKKYLRTADPQKGRFRSFLLTALKHFLANEWDKANCQKRGGGYELVSFDAQDTEDRYLSEPVEQASPEKLFDRSWAAALLAQVMARLKAEFSINRSPALFEELAPFLSGDDDQVSYSEISRRTGASEGALRVNVYRLRQRYREIL